MALDALTVTGDLKLAVVIRDGTSTGFIERTFGKGVVEAFDISLGFGATTGLANKLYLAKRTLAGVTYDLIDLNGSLLDGLGNTFSPTRLKLAAVAIDIPDGTKKLRAGPQAQVNPFLGDWGGLTAPVYKAFTHWELIVYEPVLGYVVTPATGDILPLYNPGATALDY